MHCTCIRSLQLWPATSKGVRCLAVLQALPTTVGNSCVLKLAKHGITEVWRL